jgi:hypothetical protein
MSAKILGDAKLPAGHGRRGSCAGDSHPHGKLGLVPMQHVAWVDCASRWFAQTRNIVNFETPSSRESHSSVVMVQSGKAIRRLQLAGGAETGEPGDLNWSDEEDLATLAGRIVSNALPVSLTRVPADSHSISALQQAARGRAIVKLSPSLGSPYITLDARWNEPQTQFNAGRRSDFRRAQRHGEDSGGLKFELHEALGEADLDRVLDEAFDVEARSWKGQCGTSMTHDVQLGHFFRCYAHHAMRAGILRISIMRVGEVAAGMQLAVEWQGRWWLLKIGYDPQYSHCSPGNLLLLYTLGEAARRGLESYEFLGSPAPWTAHWTINLRSFVHLRLYPASFHGLLALGQDSTNFVSMRARASVSQLVAHLKRTPA